MPDQLTTEARALRADVAALAAAVGVLARRVGVSRQLTVGLIVSFVLVLLLTAGLVVTQIQGARFMGCQAHYNEINNARTRALTDVSDDERRAERAATDALNTLLLDPALSKPAGQRSAAEQQRVQELFATWRQAAETLRTERAKADRARSANPVLPPPSVTCGKVTAP